jgi:hypothetical protein
MLRIAPDDTARRLRLSAKAIAATVFLTAAAAIALWAAVGQPVLTSKTDYQLVPLIENPVPPQAAAPAPLLTTTSH